MRRFLLKPTQLKLVSAISARNMGVGGATWCLFQRGVHAVEMASVDDMFGDDEFATPSLVSTQVEMVEEMPEGSIANYDEGESSDFDVAVADEVDDDATEMEDSGEPIGESVPNVDGEDETVTLRFVDTEPSAPDEDPSEQVDDVEILMMGQVLDTRRLPSLKQYIMLNHFRAVAASTLDRVLEILNKDSNRLVFAEDVIEDLSSNIPPYFGADEEQLFIGAPVSDGTIAKLELRGRNDFNVGLDNDTFSMALNSDGEGDAAVRWSSMPFRVGQNTGHAGVEAKSSLEISALTRMGPISAKVMAQYIDTVSLFTPLLCAASYRLVLNNDHEAHVGAKWEPTDSLVGNCVFQGPQYGIWGSFQFNPEGRKGDQPTGYVGASFTVADTTTIHCAATLRSRSIDELRGGFETKLDHRIGRPMSVFGGVTGNKEVGLGVSTKVEGLASLSMGMHCSSLSQPARFGLEIRL